MKTALLAAAAFTVALMPTHAIAKSDTVMVADQAATERFTVEIVGDGARDAILIPGLLSPRSVWEGQTDTLLAAGYRVHLVQVNGFGGTPPGKNAQGPVLPFLVRDLARYIAARGLNEVHVVGHSMGGFTALNLALDRPELIEEIMIIDSLPFFSVLMGIQNADAAKPQATAMRDMMAAQATAKLPKPDCAAPSAQARGMAKSPEAQCKVDRYTATADLAVGGNLMFDIMTTDLRPRLSKLTVPVTMLYPVDPPAITAEAAKAIYPIQYEGTPDITFVPVEGARHFIMLDQPAKTNAALNAFLDD